MKKHNRIFFSKVKYTFLAFTLSVVIICSFFFYIISRQLLLDRTCLSDVNSLRQVQIMADDMKHVVGNLSYQVFSDPAVAYLLYGEDFQPDQLTVAISQLNNYRNTNPYIDSIYIYNRNWDSLTVSSNRFGTFDAPVSGKEAFFDHQVIDLLMERSDSEILQQPMARVVQKEDETFLYYTYLTSNSFRSQNIQSAVFVNFSSRWMDDVLRFGKETSSDTLIVDAEGIVICNNQKWPVFTDLSDQEFYRDIQKCSDTDGYSVCWIDGAKYVVSYFKPDNEAWQYMRLTPYEVTIGGIDYAIRALLLIAAGLTIAGSLIAYFFSRRIYRPIQQMQQGMDELEEENRATRQLSKQHQLQNLLLGFADPQILVSDGLLDNLKARDAAPKRYLLVLIRIVQYHALYQEHDTEGRNALRYAVLNIASEICSSEFYVETVDMGGVNHLAMILSIPAKKYQELTYGALDSLLEKTNTAVGEAIGLSLKFSVSESFFSFTEIPEQFRLAQDTLFHHIFYPAGTILHVHTIRENIRQHYNYPQLVEDRMIEAIMRSHEEKACSYMKDILLETKDFSFSVVNLAVSHITLSLTNVIDEIQKNRFIEIPDSVLIYSISASNLQEIESIDQLIENFSKLIHQLVELLNDKKNAKHTDLLQNIINQIQKNFCDPACCLDSIAASVGLSSAYVGKLYKRYTLKSVSESINELRIEEAKHLLESCHRMTIADIAEKTGFSSGSYFSKSFRKETGMTPNEYRNLHKISGEQ